MIIYLLLFDGDVERASTDREKLEELCQAYNGGDDLMGPYDVFDIELEDFDESEQEGE